MHEKMLNSKVLVAATLAVALVFVGFASVGAQDTSAATEATCRAWLATGAGAVEPADQCHMPEVPQRDRVRELDGAVFPMGYDRYYVVSLPENIDPQSPPPIVLLLHGGASCAEVFFNEWACSAQGQGLVVASLQYTNRDWTRTTSAEAPEKLYAELRTVVNQLRGVCPLADSPVAVVGMSLGAVKSYSLALLDRASDDPLFDLFVADSGGWPQVGGEREPYVGVLSEAAGDEYRGARFWMHCNQQDVDRCGQMAQIALGLENHGADIEEFYFDPFGRHGIFSLPAQPQTSRAAWALFDNLRNLKRARKTK